jgi:hypothetical protein
MISGKKESASTVKVAMAAYKSAEEVAVEAGAYTHPLLTST